MTRKMGAKKEKVRVLFALICDSVRREITGKELLVGVYGNDIVFASLPGFTALTLWVRLRFEELQSIPVEFRVIDDQGQQIAALPKVDLVPPRNLDDFAQVIFEHIPLQIQSAGAVLFQWRPPDAEWETIARLRITVGPITTLSYVQPTPTVS